MFRFGNTDMLWLLKAVGEQSPPPGTPLPHYRIFVTLNSLAEIYY